MAKPEKPTQKPYSTYLISSLEEMSDYTVQIDFYSHSQEVKMTHYRYLNHTYDLSVETIYPKVTVYKANRLVQVYYPNQQNSHDLFTPEWKTYPFLRPGQTKETWREIILSGVTGSQTGLNITSSPRGFNETTLNEVQIPKGLRDFHNERPLGHENDRYEGNVRIDVMPYPIVNHPLAAEPGPMQVLLKLAYNASFKNQSHLLYFPWPTKADAGIRLNCIENQ